MALYRAQGHLLEVTDVVDKMAASRGLFDVSPSAVMHKGKAYGIPQSVSPSPWSRAWISLGSGEGRSAQDLGRVHRGVQKAAEASQAFGLRHVPGAHR